MRCGYSSERDQPDLCRFSCGRRFEEQLTVEEALRLLARGQVDETTTPTLFAIVLAVRWLSVPPRF
jgi:hypothetical protein